MENADLIVDLEQRLVAVLQNEDASLSPRSTEGRARAEVLEEFRSWRKEVSLTRLAMQSERQRYRELLEMVSQGYLRTDLEGVIYEASDAAAALLDTPVESLCGRPLASFVAGDEGRTFASASASSCGLVAAACSNGRAPYNHLDDQVLPPRFSSFLGETPKAEPLVCVGCCMT